MVWKHGEPAIGLYADPGSRVTLAGEVREYTGETLPPREGSPVDGEARKLLEQADCREQPGMGATHREPFSSSKRRLWPVCQ